MQPRTREAAGRALDPGQHPGADFRIGAMHGRLFIAASLAVLSAWERCEPRRVVTRRTTINSGRRAAWHRQKASAGSSLRTVPPARRLSALMALQTYRAANPSLALKQSRSG